MSTTISAPLRAFTVNEFCAAYRLGRTLTYELIGSGELAVHKVNNRTLISAADAEDWFERHRVAAPMRRAVR